MTEEGVLYGTDTNYMYVKIRKRGYIDIWQLTAEWLNFTGQEPEPESLGQYIGMQQNLPIKLIIILKAD
jgi:hypothetical protein